MKYFICNYNNILTDLINDIETDSKHENTTNFSEADVVILWNEVDDVAKEFIRMCRLTGKKVFAVQHGRKGSSRYYPPFNEKILVDKLLVWGQADKDLLVKYGHPKKKIEVVGNPIFQHLEPREKHEDFNVIFSPEHWGVEVPENRIVKDWLDQIKGIKVSTKILTEHQSRNYRRPIVSDRNAPDHLQIVANTLKTADIVVGISESTFELCSQYLDIPVIIADIWDPKAGANGDERYKSYLRTYSNAVTKVKTKEELQKAIEEYRKNPALIREERKQICIDEGGSNLQYLKEIKRWII